MPRKMTALMVVMFVGLIAVSVEECHGQTARSYFDSASEWRHKGEFDKAISDYTESIRLDPTSDFPYLEFTFFFRGRSWHEKGELDKAISDYNEAIRLDPKFVNPYCFRGRLWSEKGEFDKAISDYNEAIRLDPKKALAYRFRGMLWSEKGEYDKAISDYNEAIKAGDATMAYRLRGMIWSEKGEYEKAISDLTKSIKRQRQNNAIAHNQLAWIRATCPTAKYRDVKPALIHATLACLQSEWKNAQYLETLAAAYAEAGNFDKAVKRQEQAIDLLGKNDDKAEYKKRLDLYKNRKPYRQEPKKK